MSFTDLMVILISKHVPINLIEFSFIYLNKALDQVAKNETNVTRLLQNAIIGMKIKQISLKMKFLLTQFLYI